MIEEPSMTSVIISLILIVIATPICGGFLLYIIKEWWRTRGRRPDNSWAYKNNSCGLKFVLSEDKRGK